jgi:hypothetical protein
MKPLKIVLLLGGILLYITHPFGTSAQSNNTFEPVANISVLAGSGEPVLNGVCSYDKAVRCLNIKFIVTNADGNVPMEFNYYYTKSNRIDHFDIVC